MKLATLHSRISQSDQRVVKAGGERVALETVDGSPGLPRLCQQ
jgi:hypothetical protein